MRQKAGSATLSKKAESVTLITFASLRFGGDRLEPERVTDILCSSPDTAYRKGEVYKRVREHEVRGKTGLWLVSSEHRVDSLDLNDHLEYLLAIVFPNSGEDRLARLHELMREQEIEADVPCFWHGRHGSAAPRVRPDIVRRFALLPAEIEPDFDAD